MLFCLLRSLCERVALLSGGKEPRNGQQAVIFTGYESATSVLVSYYHYSIKNHRDFAFSLTLPPPIGCSFSSFSIQDVGAWFMGWITTSTSITLRWTVELLFPLGVLCGGAGVPEGFPWGSSAVTSQIYGSWNNQGDEWETSAAKTTRAEAHSLFFIGHPSSCFTHTCCILGISCYVYSFKLIRCFVCTVPGVWSRFTTRAQCTI